MKLKIFTFRFSESIDGFDDKALQEFTADKEVIEYLRIHRLCQGTDPMPQPVPRYYRGQTCPARRLLVGPMARKLPPGTLRM